VFCGILQRTIFWELAKVFVLSLVGITGIIVLATIVAEASQQGLGPSQILAVIPLLVPSMLPFIIPPTTLLASCVVYGRLSHDNEVIAIKSAGINVLHVIVPGAFLGLVMSGATLGLYYYLIPHTHHLLRTSVVNDVEEFLYAMLRKDLAISRRPEMNLDYEMWVQQVQGKKLKNAIFKRRAAKGEAKGLYDVIAKAREADLHVDMVNREVIVHMRHCHVFDEGGKARGYFEDRIYSVPIPISEHRKPSPRDMTWDQLLESREEVAKKMEEFTALIEINTAQMNHFSPPDLPRHIKSLEYMLKEQKQKLDALNAELQLRPALSFGCLFFVLVGCPVGIWFSKSDYLSAFITCFLPIVFVYYPLLLCSNNLAKDGKVHPALSLWIANAAIALMAVVPFRKLVKN
jgi:lipopolysaccharide export system permease protein